ncbi:MAG: outer membrane beta-barrel protein [Thermoanaerobaculia bacterium]
MTSKNWLERAAAGSIALAIFGALGFAGLAAPASAASQQESYTFTLGLLGGVGGSFDADPDPGVTEQSFMIQLGMVTEPRTMVSIRAGKLKLDGDEGLEDLLSADLEYVNVAGEYRFAQSYYDYGVYLGLGYYRLSGPLRTGGDDSDSDIGIVLGFTGDFDITRHLSLVGEISAHYAFLDQASIYGMANVGLAVHF